VITSPLVILPSKQRRSAKTRHDCQIHPLCAGGHNYRYREHLFPSSQFRKVYDLLKDVAPRRCDHRYLEILELAAKEGEARVEDALRLLLQTETGKQTIVNRESFREFLDRCEQAPDITDVQIADVSLASFDQLFSQPGALQ
jgi:hypothetical protein